MKIGNLEIKIRNTDPYENLRTRQQGKFAASVKEYSSDSYSQEFSQFRSIQGERNIDYDLIDGLYESTIFNKLVNKIVSDTVSDFYSIQITDVEGQRLYDLETECKRYHSNIGKQNLKHILRETLKYGSSALYIGEKENDIISNPFSLELKNLEAQMKDGVLDYWKYNDGEEDLELPPEDVAFFANDVQTGEIYGKSFLGPVIHTLHLFLNTELNLSEIVDKFVLPILVWTVKGEGEVSDKKIMELANSIMQQYSQGSDIIVSEEIENSVIGANQHAFDLVPILHELKETLGILTVPFQILGGKADNLSSSKVQFSSYLRTIKEYREIITEGLINYVYKPYMEANGYIIGEDIGNIYINFPAISIETPGEAAAWIFPSLRQGLISREEARNALGYGGLALDPNDVIVLSETDQGSVDNPVDKSGKGDPASTTE